MNLVAADQNHPEYRLAVLNSHPIQYFAPLYAHLHRDPALQLVVFYCSDSSIRGELDPGFKRNVQWDVDLLGGYRSVFLGSAAGVRTPAGFWSLVCPQVVRQLWTGRYDAVLLHGYNFAVTLLAFLTAKLRGIPVLMRSDAHIQIQRKGLKGRIRNAVLTFAYRFVDGFLAIGTSNRAYYRSLGVPERKIFHVPFAVDNDRWIESCSMTAERRAEVRHKYGLGADSVVVLFAGKFSGRKRPHDVLNAAKILKDKGISVDVLMVGAGELESELRALAAASGIERVVFAGFVNQSRLPEVYGISDIFVMPSEAEPWGLVVNEVMCAGLPVLVSEEVGCVADLVKHGVNGYHYRAGDVAALASTLETLVNDADERRRKGAASLALINEWSFQRCAAGIMEALRACGKK